MTQSWMNVLASAMALSLTVASQTAAAQEKTEDYIAHDKQGNIRIVDDAAGFGSKGQWTFSTDAAFSFERKTTPDSSATTKLSIQPATDYFIVKNLSLGGVVAVEYTKAGDTKDTTFKLGPRVGFNFEFSRMMSLWPKLGFSYAHTKHDGGDTTRKNNAVALNLFAPLMFHPAAHFFVGIGPFLDTDLNGDNRSTTWGFRLALGGWL